MIHLLHGREVDSYFDGARDAKTVRTTMKRVRGCAACRRRYERHLLFERVRPEAPAADRLWQSIQASAAGAPRAVRVTPARAALLVAAFAAVLVVVVPRRHGADDGAFVARGGGGVATPTLHLYRNRGGRAEAVAGTVRGGDGLLVAYSNPSDLTYLMVLAVDRGGEVHWYYPAYERLGDDPVAVPIRARTLGVELGEEIRHDLPAGPLKMVAMFLPAPRHVLEVERAVSAASGGTLDGLAGPGGVTFVLPLEVAP